jgi:hypothetical protein
MARLLRASPDAQAGGAAEGELVYLERSIAAADGDSGGELICRTTSLRAGDGGGDKSESAAGISSHTRAPLLLLFKLVLTL